MTLDIQFKIKNNPNYVRYLRENSYWYKILNRNPSMFNEFVNEVKKEYHLRTTDRISNAINTIELLQNIVSNLK
jgi:hypothetical protein